MFIFVSENLIVNFYRFVCNVAKSNITTKDKDVPREELGNDDYTDYNDYSERFAPPAGCWCPLSRNIKQCPDGIKCFESEQYDSPKNPLPDNCIPKGTPIFCFKIGRKFYHTEK